MHTRLSSAALFVGGLLFAAPAAAQLQFQDVTVQQHAEFNHKDGAYGYSMGGGVGWFDLENDGDEDLFCASSDGRHKLLRREAQGFVDATTGSGLYQFNPVNSTIGVLAADYDEDGFSDLYLTNTAQNQLFRNQGNGSFVDLAPALKVDGNSWSSCAAWADFDLDGDLDLYVGNYVAVLNFPYHVGAPNNLYVNSGSAAQPQFFDWAPPLGVDNIGYFGPTVPGYPYVSPTGQLTAGCTLSIATLDFDEDGDPELMVGNDFGEFVLPNAFYRNDTPPGGLLSFTNIADANGFSQRPHYDMGINFCDYDHDGDWDVYNSNLGDNLLLRNDNGIFTDQTYAAGPVEGLSSDGNLLLSSWDSVWGDYDNDGWEDLLVINGLIPAAGFIANDARAEDHLWLNQQDGTFTRLDPNLSGMNDRGAGRGCASSDFDGDGLLDWYVMNNGAAGVAFPGDTCRLYRNQGLLPGASSNHWLQLALAGWSSHHEGIGTRIELHSAGSLQKRQVLGDPIYISTDSRIQHFGLGSQVLVQRLDLHWQSGIEQSLLDLPSNQRWSVAEPRVSIASLGAPTWDGSALHFPVALENHSGAAQEVFLLYRFFLAGGAYLLELPVQVQIDAQHNANAELSLALDAATHALLAGLPLEQRVYAGAAGAFDSEALAFPLP